jgi:hypothetical protein
MTVQIADCSFWQSTLDASIIKHLFGIVEFVFYARTRS